jgi:Terpene cyclase DEP1
VKLKTLYLTLCIVGVVLPYWQFLPWLAANGMNFPLFFHQLFANRISAFFGMDVIVSAVALMIFVRKERPQLSGAVMAPPDRRPHSRRFARAAALPLSARTKAPDAEPRTI